MKLSEFKGLEIKIALLEEKLSNSKENLALQAKEYERRLSALNHEAEQLKSMQAEYVPRETYNTEHKSMVNELGALQKFQACQEGKASRTDLYIAYALSGLSLILAVFKLFK